jgi:thymidylate synthase
MNKLDLGYQNLLKDILENGVEKNTRNGKVISVFGRQIRHKMSEGFPLLTTKKMYWNGIVTELLWFLRGDTTIKFLVDNDCHIWDGDAYKNYCKIAGSVEEPNYDIHVDDPNQNCTRLMTKEEFINRIKTDDEFAKTWAELGPVYGKQWRRWTKKKMYLSTDGSYENIYGDADQTVIDQIAGLINGLKTNPDSRRLMVNSWNVGEISEMVLPPCHYGFQVYTRELSLDERLDWLNVNIKNPKGTFIPKLPYEHLHSLFEKYNVPKRAISLMFNQRSVDVPLGLPFNIASYGLLLELLAKMTNMVPDELIGNLGDCHIYKNQIDGVKEQLTREPYPLPKLKILDSKVDDIAHYEIGDFIIEGYQSHPAIKMPLSN